MFEGTYTALVTPFRDGEVDYDALGGLLERQIAAGITGVVPCGSTGESATLSHGEHERVIGFTIDKVAGRAQVIAGTGSNCTATTTRLTRFAKDKGADGALLITPYYNKPTQDGLYAHFSAVAESVDIPIVTYNIPGRSALTIEVDTLAKLAEIPNIVGVKDATGSLDMATRTIQACGPDFTLLSGDDPLTLPMMRVGARGVISVISNLLPAELIALVAAATKGDFATARKLHYAMLPLNLAMGLETNPIPVKAALALRGDIGPELRLPLTPLREANMDRLRALLDG